ncbi:MAG TPA: HD domain-containing protein [Patescibacteria group bacterium]|nr:HD domain-containing protein [Patescibacteria group bacterium]
MLKALNIEFEKTVRLLSEHMPVSDEKTRKPILFHDIRVGVYLYEHGYSREIILGGLLHDTLEFSEITEQMLRDEFGDQVTKLVLASTKDDSIEDKEEKTKELINRCIQNGQDALIVKTADILDSFKYYTATNNSGEIEYCMRNARAIFDFMPTEFNDKIFAELQQWMEKSV